MSDDREIRADAKLKNLPPEALETMWEWRNPRPGDEVKTYEEIQGEVPLHFGFTVSLSTLSEFYSWLRMRRRADRARMRADQAKLEWLKENPEASPEDLSKLAQMVFTSETLEDGDIKAFVALRKLQLKEKQIAQDERRIQLLEEKAQKADAAEAIAKDTKTTSEEKAVAVRELFGITG